MLNSALLIGSLILYVLATVFIAKCILATHSEPSSAGKSTDSNSSLAFTLACFATLLHLSFASSYSFVGSSINFSLSSMTVIVSGLVCLVYILGGLAMPIRRLGVIVFPLTIISLVFSQLWQQEVLTLNRNNGSAASIHILVSILAYCLLAIAAIQALLYVYQERQIKNRTTPTMLMALPPIQTMEQLLFRLVWMGFILLSVTLLSGAIFSHQIFGQPFEFNHHTILASLGWVVFAIMLAKRITQGLRGSQAAYWAVGGFLLIQLGYFGTKVVSESLAVQ